MAEHRLHLYTGEGKGKTTAAMGLALRALGHGQRVLIAQFMKDGRTGELAALRQVRGVEVFPAKPMSGFTFRMSAAQLEQTRLEQTEQAAQLTTLIADTHPQMVILDELAMAISLGLVGEQEARALLEASLACAETVVTGRSSPDWLREKSDYVSVIKAEKHPYETEGLPAREGVEW